MNPAIFREYDIRGKCPDDLNRGTVYELGHSIGDYLRGKGAKKISVGRDCRLSSPELRNVLIKGLTETGMDIADIGMAPTPLLYFSIHHLNLDGGVQITGSHNPPDENGFKVCLGTGSVYGEEIQKIREISEAGKFQKGQGKVEDVNVFTPYLDYLKKNIIPGDIKRKVVIDAGNGVGGLVAPDVYRAMGIEVTELFCEPDGNFPNHHPDPTIPANLSHLIREVAEKSADLGIAFDGDADRIGVIDREGNIIWGDQLMIIFSRDLLEQKPGAKIIGEVKCSQTLYDDIKKHGGTPIMWKAGHSLIKSKMKEVRAVLAGEMSGHLFFADRYFGYDDAIYAGARILEILTRKAVTVRDLLSGVPSMVNTPEIRIDCPDDRKFQAVARLVETFKKEYDVIDVDGARVLFDGGWGLVRASNTQAVLVLRFEAGNEKRLNEIKELFMKKVDEVIQERKHLMKKEIRVRFAPSPTGYLHIGGARTAIYNWLFAKKNNGKFILRIEDTDVERSTQDSIQGIIDGLTWLGITWDEGPYFQSEFIGQHQEAARKLIETGHAYKCFCTKEELEAKREKAFSDKADTKYDGTCRGLTKEQVEEKEAAGIPYTIRLKVPRTEGSMKFKDEVYGYIEKRYEDIEDFVIVRSNGQPLYVLSNAVDDIRDGITHILRGQDGLANTPKQILIYNALGEQVPVFAHMSLTLDNKKAKISKRVHGEIVAVHFYRDRGFIPWAFVNFLVLLGWSTPESKQIFSREELINAFSLEGINKANSIFDVRTGDPKFFTDPKAISINSHYVRNLPIDELIPYVKADMEKEGIWDAEFEGSRKEWFAATLELIRERYNFITDFATLGRPFFSDDFPMEEGAVNKNVLKHEGLKTWFQTLADRFENLSNFDNEGIENVIRDMAEKENIKAGILINGIRTAVTGQAVGPGIFELLNTLGRDRVVKRLRKAMNLFG